MVFSDVQHVAAKIGQQWMDAIVIGRNKYGGLWFYTVKTLDGKQHTVKQSECWQSNEIDEIGDGSPSDDIDQYLKN